MWMLSICIATLPLASWLAVEAPPSLRPSPPSPPPLSLLPLAHIFWNGGADAGCVWVCVPAQGCSFRYRRCYRLVSLRTDISRWGTSALLGTTYRYNHAVYCTLLQLSNTCKWDSDLTMVPFLWTTFETTGGGKRGKLRMSVLIFWRKSLCTEAVSLFLSRLSSFPGICIFWNINSFLFFFKCEDASNFVSA